MGRDGMSGSGGLFYRAVTITCGLYIGKYYPQYVPLPQINKTNIDALLCRLEEITRVTGK
jgi:hypothetical protein